MTTIEMGSYVYDYPGKGHDRVFTDVKAGVMGILDGAGTDAHSHGAILALEDAVRKEAHQSDEATKEEFDYRGRSKFFGAHLIRYASAVEGYKPENGKGAISAGAIIDLRSSYNPQMNRIWPVAVNRGDTSIFVYNRDFDEFIVVADAADRPSPTDGHVDVADFFGYSGESHPYHLAKNYEILGIPVIDNQRFDEDVKENVRYDDELIIVAATDGLYEGEPLGNRGMTIQDIEEIMRTSRFDAQGIADEMGSIVENKYDDASVVVSRILQTAQ